MYLVHGCDAARIDLVTFSLLHAFPSIRTRIVEIIIRSIEAPSSISARDSMRNAAHFGSTMRKSHLQKELYAEAPMVGLVSINTK